MPRHPDCGLAPPQLTVEAYFATQKVLATYYWLGLEKRQNLYYWQDGTRVNNGNVSNADPCELEICLCLVSWSVERAAVCRYASRYSS